MVQVISVMKLLLDLGTIIMHICSAAIDAYREFMADFRAKYNPEVIA